MSREGTDPEDGRGQAAVVGIVLLVGLVAVGGIGILLIGGQVQEESKQRIDDQRIEDSFLELDRTIATVATGGVERADVNFDLADRTGSEAAIRRENTGTIVINRTNLTTTQTVAVRDIGSIVYSRNGEQYAYQAGAVWRNAGNATQIVSPPQAEYSFFDSAGASSPTLNLEIAELQGDERIRSGAIGLEHNRTIAPFNDVSTVENQLVTVSVTSEYYVGWGKYFEERYPGITTVSYDHPAETVTIELGQRDISGNYSDGVLASSYTTGGGGKGVTGPMTVASSSLDGPSGEQCSDPDNTCGASVSQTPLDTVIQGRIDEADGTGDDWTNVNAGTVGTIGTTDDEYYTPGFSLTSPLTIDLSNGNVSMVVDGPIAVSNGPGPGGGTIKVINADQNATCCYARLYVGGGPNGRAGDIALANGGAASEIFAGDGSGSPTNNATRLQIYGTSEMQFSQGQGSFRAAVYAPRNDAPTGPNEAMNSGGPFPSVDAGASAGASCPSGTDACVGTGSNGFTGALIGFDSVATTASGTITYDTALKTVRPTISYVGAIPPPITFLQVAVSQICVGEGTVDCPDGTPSTSTSTATATPTSTSTPTTTSKPTATATPTPTATPSPPTFADTNVEDKSDKTGKKADRKARYQVSYDTDDPAGDPAFGEVVVEFDWAGGSETVTLTDPSRTITRDLGTGAYDQSVTITLTLDDDDGDAVECREYTDTADAKDSPSGYSSC